MASYTMTLQQIIDLGYDIFPATYTLFDPTHSADLESLITDHFYLREIGAETVDRFLLYFQRTFKEFLPIANKLYEAQTLDTLANLSKSSEHTYTQTGTDETADTGTQQNSATGSASNTLNDGLTNTVEVQGYPQTPYSSSSQYLTNKTVSTNDGSQLNNTNSSSSNTLTLDTLHTITKNLTNTDHGRDKQIFEIISDYKDKIYNVDLMFCDKLDDCFMQVF